MYYFCTYFDHRYLPKGLALYWSLRQYCPEFKLWVLCLNQTCYDVLSQLNLPDINLIAMADFERGDEALKRTKQNRTTVEYYFTCTPSLPLFVLKNNPEVDMITYLDSDLFFFSEPYPIYAEIADRSIGIIEHRFSPERLSLKEFGIYNVGWLSFRRDLNGLDCLRWWRERCIEWCYDRPENGRFADQKYLDDWPSRFQGVAVIKHKGANVSHWNTNNYLIYAEPNRVWVDEQPLIFFHFHGFKVYKNAFEKLAINPNMKIDKYGDSVIFKYIYGPYMQKLREIAKQVYGLLPEVSIQSSIRGPEITENDGNSS